MGGGGGGGPGDCPLGRPRFCIYVQSLPRKSEEKRDCRARVCKRLWSPGIHSASLCSLAGRYFNRVVVPVRQAKNRFLVSLKGLQIRAPVGRGNSRTKIRNDIIMQISGFQGGNKHTENQTN